MEFERPYSCDGSLKTENEKKEIEPNNLVKNAKRFVDLIFNAKMIGKDNIKEIFPGKKVIIATTHI